MAEEKEQVTESWFKPLCWYLVDGDDVYHFESEEELKDSVKYCGLVAFRSRLVHSVYFVLGGKDGLCNS